MYVHEERLDAKNWWHRFLTRMRIRNPKKLSEVINTEHVNVKYLPGVKLPENIVSVAG